MNPDLDLSIERIIRAPRKLVWEAWTDPASLAQWWLPAPLLGRVERLEVRPGGAFVTSMSEDGTTFTPHVDGCFLLVEESERLVFTNAVDSAWRPANPMPISMTAEVTMLEHPEGTSYRIVARHADPEAKDRHLELGFTEGWGTVVDQLARFVERAR